MKTPTLNSLRIIPAILCLLLSLLAKQAEAAVYYWDPNGTTSVGGNSTWDTTSKLWSTASTQVASSALVAWAAGDAACFCAGPTGSASEGTFTVTVNAANISIGGIYNGALSPGSCYVTLSGSGSTEPG